MKQKILIASFLKPVNDIRAYEKIAKSLAKNNAYKIYSLGYPSNIELSDNKITLLPLSSFNKNSFSRVKARVQAFKIYLKVKPQLIIVNSSDLLLLTILYKILFGSRIIYDVRENYYKNLWHQKNYKWGINFILAIIIRTKEVITAPLFNHFILAEKVYATQLRFIKGKFSIIENKCLRPKSRNQQKATSHNLRFLISGTIAKEFGVMAGIELFKTVLEKYPNSSLLIIGHCPNNSLLKTLQNYAKNISKIRLHISKNPVAHTLIETEILKATIGLLPYLPNKSINGKWPTKLFEYMGYNLPFIIQKNSTWNELVEREAAWFTYNFLEPSNDKINSIIYQLTSTSFNNKEPSEHIYWNQEEPILTKVVKNIIKQD